MDTKGLIHEHSKIKLELYRLYLERYLSVLLVANFFNRIDIIDVFAGCGISDNDEKGSALIAAETIDTISKNNNPQRKQVFLKLNDADQQNCSALQQHLQPYQFASVTCDDANTFIQNWRPVSNGHNLFFIDPHGYTQIDTANLKRLFTAQNCDFLIFVPIYHIYRFLKPTDGKKPVAEVDGGFLGDLCQETKKRKQVDPAVYYAPIAKFLAGLGIDQETAKQANSVEEFANLISNALRTISGSEYVYCQMLENKEKNSKYSLFFISHHILGAEKFLDAQNELKNRTTTTSEQQAFDFISPPDENSITNFMSKDIPLDNVALYEHGIRWGILPSELNRQLGLLEQAGKITVADFPPQKRRGKFFYINNKYHKNGGDRRITVTFRG